MIEAGFPMASQDDFEAVRAIAMEIGNNVDSTGYAPAICGLSRSREPDIERAWEAVRHARHPRVHIFLATSPIHMEHKLRMSRDQVLRQAVESVAFCRALGCPDVEFSPEDATRSEPAFLYEVLREVIRAGATTINIPDTTGWALPHEYGAFIADLRRSVEGAEGVVFSTHCQNDLGLSTANSLAGAQGGARQVECTINGIGERAGNASLEEVVMASALRGADQLGGLRTGIDAVHLAPTSKMVSDYSGMPVQPHKAIVGANAFAHESGIHQDGMLKSRDTYEIMTPESIGLVRAQGVGLVLGKHSGRHALATRLKELGFADLPSERVNDIFRRFKDLADKKKNIADDDLLALVQDEVHQPTAIWQLQDLQVVCGSMGLPTATVKLLGPDGIHRVAVGMGTGPVDAAYKAIDSLVRIPVDLVDYGMTSVTGGIEALATTRVIIRPAGELASTGTKQDYKGRQQQRTFSGQGAHEDVVVSSARAYISALNRMIPYISAQAHAATAAVDNARSAETATATVVV